MRKAGGTEATPYAPRPGRSRPRLSRRTRVTGSPFLPVALAAGLVLAACSSAPKTPAASAGSSTRLLDPGHAEAIATPSGLSAPADGALNGPSYTAEVTSSGQTASTTDWRAGPGDVLEAFAFSWDVSADDNGNTAAASLRAGSYSAGLPNLAGQGSAAYVMAVPKASHVILDITRDGTTEGFDLTAGHRLASDAAAYYRSRTGIVSDVLSAEKTVTVTTSNGDSYPVSFSLGTETLDYLSPTGQPASGADDAWLVTDLSEVPSGPTAPGEFDVIPPGDITLSVPGLAPIPVQVDDQGSAGPKDYNGLLDGAYYFPVPAGLTTATLSIASCSVAYAPDLLTDSATASVPGLSFSLSFPAPPPTPVAAPAVHHANGPTAKKTVTSTVALHPIGPLDDVAGGAGVLAVLVAGGVIVTRRRRRGVAATPSAADGLEFPWPPASSTAQETNTAEPIEEPTADPDQASPRPETDADAPLVSPLGSESLELAHAVDTPVPETPLAAAPATDTNGTAPKPPPAPTRQPPVPSVDPERVAPRPLVEARVMGKPDWSGLLNPPSRCLELFCFLVTHPGRYWSDGDLAGAMRPVGGEISEASIRDYASQIRRSLPDGVVLPEAKAAGGYQLSGSVGSDWDRFRALTEAAGKAGDDRDKITLLTAALDLAGDRGFSGIKAGTFTWVSFESLDHRINDAIRQAKADLSAAYRRQGDYSSAQKALSLTSYSSLSLDPAMADELLRVTAHLDDSYSFDAARLQVETLGLLNNALVDELLQQRQRRRDRDIDHGHGLSL